MKAVRGMECMRDSGRTLVLLIYCQIEKQHHWVVGHTLIGSSVVGWSLYRVHVFGYSTPRSNYARDRTVTVQESREDLRRAG
jgi:hypothetical protein